ncbi:MAG: hypothetical protein WCP29_00425 [Acidobacteriota bacterium]
MPFNVECDAGWIRRVFGSCRWLAAAMLLWGAVGASAQTAPGPMLFRLFLKSGAPLVSWGECARVGDRVVFTLALGDSNEPSALQMMSLPAALIDWERTNAYADTVRYQRYAQTRGESDYKALTDEMARALTAIAFSRDAVARLAAAQEARRRLVEWPAQHFGYRATDVRDLASAVEETIAGLRADAGERHFSIDLVATIEPPTGAVLPPPTTKESIELAAEAARTTDVAADRMSLQAAILTTLSRLPSGGGSDWAASMRRRVASDEKAAAKVDRQYREFVSRALRAADKRVARVDVTGVERVLADARRRDDTLGRRRPGDFQSLVAALEARVETTRQRRLDLDRWTYRDETYRVYREGVASSWRLLDQVRATIEAIRSMSGPDLRDLEKADRRIGEARVALAFLAPPDQLHASHQALVSAVQLMQAAINTRRLAVTNADLEAARNGSAAAAGALLLVARSRDDISAFFAPPKPR